MVRPVDTSAIDNVLSIADFDKKALAEARKRAAEDQGLEIQRRQAEMLENKFKLDQAKFEEDKARAAQGLFTGDSIQAQIGNQMAGLGYTPQQIIESLTMKGVPLQDGGFATYSPPSVVGRPGTQASAQQMPAQALAPRQDALTPLNPQQMAAEAQKLIDTGRMSPALNVMVKPGLKAEEVQKQLQSAQSAEAMGNQNLSVLNDLIDENGNLRPGVDTVIGPIAGRVAPTFPITSAQRKYQPYINQIKGQAFLQAFDQLKGGGAITEVEGQKATQAMARLEQYQDPKDYAQALKDLRDIMAKGIERAKQRSASVSPNGLPQAATGAAYEEGDQDVDPKTGKVLAVFTNGKWVRQ